MNIKEAKKSFVDLWGNFGTQWGINRSMAQVHAVLLTSQKELCTDDVMEILSISRGNANMNLRELMNWNLIYKVFPAGERREFFKAEKDMWEVAKRIVRERKRREIEPLVHYLNELKKVDNSSNEAQVFVKTVGDIERLVTKLDTVSETMMKAEENKFIGAFVNLFK